MLLPVFLRLNIQEQPHKRLHKSQTSIKLKVIPPSVALIHIERLLFHPCNDYPLAYISATQFSVKNYFSLRNQNRLTFPPTEAKNAKSTFIQENVARCYYDNINNFVAKVSSEGSSGMKIMWEIQSANF